MGHVGSGEMQRRAQTTTPRESRDKQIHSSTENRRPKDLGFILTLEKSDQFFRNAKLKLLVSLQNKRRASTQLENLGIPEEELLRQQQELFQQARPQQAQDEQEEFQQLQQAQTAAYQQLSQQQQQQQQMHQPSTSGAQPVATQLNK